MKIFFLTQFYFDLHKPILYELEKQGHEVFQYEDKRLPLDPNSTSDSLIKRRILKIVRRVARIEEKYWKKQIASDDRFSDKYDLFMCIDGVSFHPFLLQHLKSINPDIKASLYLWDTNKHYDFFRYNDYYDRVMTFDIDDAANTDGVEVLHSYWFPSKVQEPKYKLFVVGSDHDDRLFIISEIYKQLKVAELPCFLRVVINKPKLLPWYYALWGHGKTWYLSKMKEYESKNALPFTSDERVPVVDIVKYIDETECILDTDMPIQTGATERVIWALARGKKIISTNYNLKRMSFYNPDQIKFIDRKNPIVDIDFLKKKEIFPVNEEIQNLRIDKWIHRLIDF